MKYSRDLELKLIELYKSGLDSREIAIKLDLPLRSVASKLPQLGCPKRNKLVQPRETKADLIDELSELYSLDELEADSLEKVNKTVLRKLINALDNKSS